MSSQAQIDANRRNALLSTGPRTPEGKAVSRCNALKSGIHAKSQVIPGEDPAELQALAEGYHHDWAPASYLESFLVDSLVRADWLLRRLSRIEAETWTHEIEEARKSVFNKLDEDAPLGHIYGRTDDRFTRLQRRIDSTERSYYRALTQLQRLRAGARPAPEAGDFDGTNPISPAPPLDSDPDDITGTLPAPGPCTGDGSSPAALLKNEPDSARRCSPALPGRLGARRFRKPGAFTAGRSIQVTSATSAEEIGKLRRTLRRPLPAQAACSRISPRESGRFGWCRYQAAKL